MSVVRVTRAGLGGAAVAAVVVDGRRWCCVPTASPRPPRRAVPVLAPSTVPVPTVEGPITGPGTPSIITTSFDLATVGYQEDEYFISGTATSYRLKGAAPADGRWKVTRAATARYKTRLLVYRPSDPRKFNGTVVVEWLNESAGCRHGPRLDRRPHRAHPPGLRLGRRLGPGSRA